MPVWMLHPPKHFKSAAAKSLIIKTIAQFGGGKRNKSALLLMRKKIPLLPIKSDWKSLEERLISITRYRLKNSTTQEALQRSLAAANFLCCCSLRQQHHHQDQTREGGKVGPSAADDEDVVDVPPPLFHYSLRKQLHFHLLLLPT